MAKICPIMSRPKDGNADFVFCQENACQFWAWIFFQDVKDAPTLAYTPENDESRNLHEEKTEGRERYKYSYKDGKPAYVLQRAKTGMCAYENLHNIGD